MARAGQSYYPAQTARPTTSPTVPYYNHNSPEGVPMQTPATAKANYAHRSAQTDVQLPPRAQLKIGDVSMHDTAPSPPRAKEEGPGAGAGAQPSGSARGGSIHDGSNRSGSGDNGGSRGRESMSIREMVSDEGSRNRHDRDMVNSLRPL